MSLNIATTTFILLYCISCIESQQYRYDYKYVSEIDGWIKVHLFPAKWRQARLRCHHEGAELASPETPQLAAMLKSIATERFQCGMYTGIHASFSPGDYFSVEGTPIARMSIEWAPNEPDNHEGKEECIILQGNGTAADVKCTDLYPYVCYRSRVKNPVILNECGTVDPEYHLDKRTGSCYKFHRLGRTWSRAFMECAAEGAYLAIVNSQLENKLLFAMFTAHSASEICAEKKRGFHLGYQNWGEYADWTTIHGQSVEATGFSPFLHCWDTPIVSECGAMSMAPAPALSCENTGAFICEKSPDSLL